MREQTEMATLQIDLDTGRVLSVARSVHGRPGQKDQYETLYFHRTTGYVTREEYREEIVTNDKVFHRLDGPALVERSYDGRLRAEHYCLKGRLHRDPKLGPAYIAYSQRHPEIAVEENYLFEDRPYRDPKDGPWRITRDPSTGDVLTQEYLTADQFEHKSEPACERRHVPMILHPGRSVTYEFCVDLQCMKQESYYIGPCNGPYYAEGFIEDPFEGIEWEGTLHREDGPATRDYDDAGQVRYEQWCLEDRPQQLAEIYYAHNQDIQLEELYPAHDDSDPVYCTARRISTGEILAIYRSRDEAHDARSAISQRRSDPLPPIPPDAIPDAATVARSIAEGPSYEPPADINMLLALLARVPDGTVADMSNVICKERLFIPSKLTIFPAQKTAQPASPAAAPVPPVRAAAAAVTRPAALPAKTLSSQQPPRAKGWLGSIRWPSLGRG
jgi:hypothetical protein